MTASSTNPLIDIGNTTVSAFNTIKNQEASKKEVILGQTETVDNTPRHKVRVKVYTPQDKQSHTYFHSLSIDKEVSDFMGTAELKCPYDSDLMEYWEPARAYCVIYGANQGNYKILFVGRVREVRQVGYELSITLQDYGWKFKQLVSQSYANDNVINKDGYTIMRLMFKALKIDSWVISPAAKYRLKQVGINSDGNLTLNKKKVEKMPDLLKRLKKSNPQKSINKYTVYNKVKESELHNINNINYTLRYEKPTKTMKKIASEGKGQFSSGGNIYSNAYSSPSSTTGNGSGSNKNSNKSGDYSASGNPRPPADLCSYIGDSAVISAMKLVWSYNRGYANSYSSALNTVKNFANNHPQTYSSKVEPCLNTLSKYCTRPKCNNGDNAALVIMRNAKTTAQLSGASKAITSGVTSFVSKTVSTAINVASQAVNMVKNAWNTVTSWFR